MSIDMNFDGLERIVFYVTRHLGQAATAVTQHDSYLFWPYLLSAVLIAVVVTIVNSRKTMETGQCSFWHAARAGLSPSIWWNRSARADYRLYFANALALPLIFGLLLFTDGHVVKWLNDLLGADDSAQANVAVSVPLRVAYTIAFFVAYDFGRFVAHSALHDIPVLWEFHKVHHSAESLNPLTTFRSHPVELLVMAWIPAMLTGFVTWSFNHFGGAYITAYAFLGLHALIFAFGLVATLRHTHVWLTYGPRWGKWLISPAHHQLHHSCEARHLGCNRGFDIAIWDRLYGTLYVPGQRESFRMGLGDGSETEWHSLEHMYLSPFANAGRRISDSARRLVRN